MTENASTAPTQTVVVAQPAAPSRWIPVVMMLLGILGTCGMIIAGLTTIGGWRAQVDVQLANLSKRMDQAESNQRTYIPVLIGLSKDVTYLADRARRDDERRDRQRR